MKGDVLKTSYREDGDTVVVGLEGRLDSETAPGFQAESVERCRGRPAVLDLRDLVYVSSAGLRAIMVLRRVCPSVELENASGLVEEVLQVSDFRTLIG